MAQIPSYAVLAQSTARSKGLLFAFWPGYNVLFTEMYSNLGEKCLERVYDAITTRLERVYDAFINLFTRSVPPISEARRAHVELRTQALLPVVILFKPEVTPARPTKPEDLKT
ncbi:hypothetical protein F5880DRAFT_1510795, partial [Lentinula raphanica]